MVFYLFCCEWSNIRRKMVACRLHGMHGSGIQTPTIANAVAACRESLRGAGKLAQRKPKPNTPDMIGRRRLLISNPVLCSPETQTNRQAPYGFHKLIPSRFYVMERHGWPQQRTLLPKLPSPAKRLRRPQASKNATFFWRGRCVCAPSPTHTSLVSYENPEHTAYRCIVSL